MMFSRAAFLCMSHKKASIHLRVSMMAELPGLSEGRQGSEVEGQVLANQFAVHLFGGANDAGPPLEGG